MLEETLMYLHGNQNKKEDKVYGQGYNICALCNIYLIGMAKRKGD